MSKNIRIGVLCFLLLFAGIHNAAAQASPFVINGTINRDTGTIKVWLSANSAFYPAGTQFADAKVVNGKFTLNGTIAYPVGVSLLLNGSKYLSPMFIIQPGTQSVVCNTDSARKTPKVDNAIMAGYYTEYLDAFKAYDTDYKKIDITADSLKKAFGNAWPDKDKLAFEIRVKRNYAMHDKILLSYITSHSDSYLSLWKLTELSGFGYENIFDDMYAALSRSLKATPTGKLLGQKLRIAGSALAIGKPIPTFKSVDAAGKTLPAKHYAAGKYTLVDFWYSNCSPCLAQFADIKKTYARYHQAGFNIVGISTDKEKMRTNWLNTIKKQALPWEQYWDKNGIEAKSLSIQIFPTNFLIDGNGTIIAQNISPVELDNFLKDKLKK